MIEHTLLAFKCTPTDEMIKDLLERLDKTKLTIEVCLSRKVCRNELAQFYSHIQDKPFFADLLNCYSKDLWLIIVLKGEQAISKIRQEVGVTINPAIGSLRHAYGNYSIPGIYYDNKIHCSDSVESFKKESSILLGYDWPE